MRDMTKGAPLGHLFFYAVPLRDLRAHDRPQKAALKARPEKGPFHGIEAADGNA